MKHNKITTLILVSLLISGLLYGQGNIDKSGTTAAQFLKIGVGAKPMAMGGAYTAVANDVYGLYWNPSVITQLENLSINVTRTEWFADISHNFVGAVLPVNSVSAIGIHAVFMDIEPIQITTIENPRGTGEFYEVSDIALGLSYAREVVEFLSLGISGKYIQESIYKESASTIAFDLSSILDIPYKGIKMGMHFSNVGGKMKMAGRDLLREFDMNPDNTINTGVETRLKTQEWNLPVNFRVGLAMDVIGGQDEDVFIQNAHSRLTLAMDVNHPSDAAEHIDIGAEYAFNELVMFRGGYRVNKGIENFYYGLGINAPVSDVALSLDYGVASFDELDYVHIVSINMTINP